jgi:hypothetical protein
MSNEPRKKSSSSARIPVQAQVSPEMEERQIQQARLEAKTRRNRQIWRYLGIVLVLVVMPFAMVWYLVSVDSSAKNTEVDSSDGMPTLSDLDYSLQKGDISQLEKQIQMLDEKIASGQAPTQLSAFKDKLRIADELIRRNHDETSVRFGVLSKLSALSSLASFDREFSHREKKYDTELLAFCERYKDDDDPLVRNSASVCEFSAHVQNYLQRPTDEEFANLETKLDAFISTIVPDQFSSGLISDFFVPLMSKSENTSHVRKFNAELADRLQNSEESVFQKEGDKIMDSIVIGAINWDNMRVLIRVDDKQTVNKLESFVKKLDVNPGVSVSTYSNVLSCIEFLGSGFSDLKKSLVDELRSSIAKIPNNYKRDRVNDLIERFDVRNNLLGKPFELGTEVGKELAEPEKVPTVILFLSLANPETTEWVEMLQNLDREHPLESRFLIVCTDSNLPEDRSHKIKNEFPNAILIGPEETSDFLQQCPITHVPYIVVLDRENRVAAINVDIDRVRDQLRKLSKL